MASEKHRALLILGLSVLVVFASLGLARFGFGMIWPAMQQAMHLTNTDGGQLQSWNSLGYLLFVVIAGILAARFGPRLVVSLALGLTGLAMILTGLAPTFAVLCFSRFLSGVGGAAANVPAMALLAGWFSGRRRGLAAGCAVAGSSLGLAVTGGAVPLILSASGPNGWRMCWYGLGAVTLVIGALCAVFLRNRPADGLSREGAPSPAKAGGGTMADIRTILRAPLLWRIATAYFAFGFSYSIYATFFVKHLVADVGLTESRAGAVWMQIGLLSIVSGFLWGAVSDHWGRRRALIAIFACQGTAFCAAGIGHQYGWVVLSGLLFAFTAWSIPAVVAALCADGFGARLAPAALGVATVIFGLGQVIGPVAGGVLADTLHSSAPAFTMAGTVALVLGIGGSLLLPRERVTPSGTASPS